VAQFADGRGHVWYWDKDGDNNAVRRNPKSVHALDYLYARWNEDGVRDSSAEHELKTEIVGHAAGFINDLISAYNARGEIDLQNYERKFISRLIIRTVVRNPTILN
jgi:hypothetical protein